MKTIIIQSVRDRGKLIEAYNQAESKYFYGRYFKEIFYM